MTGAIFFCIFYTMFIFIFIMFSSILWGEKFTGKTGRWISDQRNPVKIIYSPRGIKDTLGYVHMEGNPEDVGRSSAWFYVKKIPGISTSSYISIRLKGNGNLLRFRILFKNKGEKPYYYLIKYVYSPKEWKDIKIYIKDARPIWSSNYPYALTPLLSPDFFLFVENGKPGKFSVYIHEVKVEERKE